MAQLVERPIRGDVGHRDAEGDGLVVLPGAEGVEMALEHGVVGRNPSGADALDDGEARGQLWGHEPLDQLLCIEDVGLEVSHEAADLGLELGFLGGDDARDDPHHRGRGGLTHGMQQIGPDLRLDGVDK